MKTTCRECYPDAIACQYGEGCERTSVGTVDGIAACNRCAFTSGNHRTLRLFTAKEN